MKNRCLILGEQIFGKITKDLRKGQINEGNDHGTKHVCVKKKFVGFIILTEFLENIHEGDRVPSQSSRTRLDALITLQPCKLINKIISMG